VVSAASTKTASANKSGTAVTTFESAVFMASWWALTKVSASHAMPKSAKMAMIPAPNTCWAASSVGLASQKRMIRSATVNMMIWIPDVVSNGAIAPPSPEGTCFCSQGIAPVATIMTTPTRNM